MQQQSVKPKTHLSTSHLMMGSNEVAYTVGSSAIQCQSVSDDYLRCKVNRMLKLRPYLPIMSHRQLPFNNYSRMLRRCRPHTA